MVFSAFYATSLKGTIFGIIEKGQTFSYFSLLSEIQIHTHTHTYTFNIVALLFSMNCISKTSCGQTENYIEISCYRQDIVPRCLMMSVHCFSATPNLIDPKCSIQ